MFPVPDLAVLFSQLTELTYCPYDAENAAYGAYLNQYNVY